MDRINYFKNRPKASSIDVDAYLKRIHQQKETPSLGYLRQLHRAHLMHIPFENLDIHYNRKIILDYSKIFQKIITKQRGGYCYELNGLFFHLLYHLGFDPFIISARVRNTDGKAYGKDFDHMAIIVKLDQEEYLVDVGFGKGIIYPKKIEDGLIQMDYTDYWRIVKDIDDNFLLQSSDNASVFSPKYLFRKEARELIQFLEMNEFQQNNPQSTFQQQKMITRLTDTGRITLTDRTFKEFKLGLINEVAISNEDEFLSLLEQHFGIPSAQLTRLD